MAMERFETQGRDYGRQNSLRNVIRIIPSYSGGAIALTDVIVDPKKPYVILYFDKESNEIGLEFLSESGGPSYKLLRPENRRTYYVLARKFFRLNNIDNGRQLFDKKKIRKALVKGKYLVIFGPVKMKDKGK